MNTFNELQNWFQSQCDGEWEHQNGIKIETCDNPGWWVKIDLKGTPLLQKQYEPVKRGNIESNDPQPPWLHCHVEGGVFHGAGDPSTLEEILVTFLKWAKGT